MIPGLEKAQRAIDRMLPDEIFPDELSPFNAEYDTNLFVKDFAESKGLAGNWLEDCGIKEYGLCPEIIRDICIRYMKYPNSVRNDFPNFCSEITGLAKEAYYARQD